MMHVRHMIVIWMVFVMAACGLQGATPPSGTEISTSAPLQTLDGTKWTLTFLDGAAPVNSSAVTLAFVPGSYLQGNAGCNFYGVDYIADDHRFQVPLIHRTQDTCAAPDIMQQEAAFFAALYAVAGYGASEERLEFVNAQGQVTLAFARAHPPDTGTVLPGTKYVLASLRGQPLLAGTHITLEFGKQSFSGFTGCNNYGGGPDSGQYAATDDGVLQLREFAVTAVGCPGDIMAQEKAYLEALTSAAAYQLSDRRLELQNAAGETILVYTQRAECAEGAASLAGTAWRLASVDGQAPSNAAATTLAFVDDKWYVEHSTCQGYVSSYQTSGNDLSSGFSAWLGQICQDAEDQGVTMLESPSDYCLTQGRLRITTTSGRVFVYDPLPETARPPLEGPTWSLLSFLGQRLVDGEVAPWPDPNPVREGSEITLTLAGGIASGSAGCNTYQSTYNRGTTITFGPFAVTEKACATPEGVMTQEQRYLGVLRDVTGYRLVGSELWLERDGGPALLFARIVSTPTPTSTSTPLPTNSSIALPTNGPITLPTSTPAPTVLPIPPGRPTLTLTPTATPTTMPADTPAASPTPKMELRSPMVVDSEAGRLYMSATIDGVQRVVALAATDGHLLTTYAIAGPFAVDGVHGWLYVDRDETGLTVLDARTGVPRASIALPSRKNERQEDSPAPQADPATGQVLAFRDNVVYVADPETGAITRTIPFDIPRADIDCRLPAGPLPIEWATYDSARRILYLDFETYRCTPWIGHTLLSYDMTSGAEIARGGVPPQFSATAFDGYLYGSSWFRMGDGRRWAWRDGQPWFESADWSYGAPAFAVDAPRQRLYGLDIGGLHVFDARTMALIMIAPLPVPGQLVGYDPKTDQLYSLAKGRLQPWPASAIHPPTPQPLSMSQPPTTAVRSLTISPTWAQDKTLFGIWNAQDALGTCWVFGGFGGSLLVSNDAGVTWSRSRGGLPDGCEDISALAVSPDYARDRTLLAGVVGLGLFRSIDGGQSWAPSSAGLRSMNIEQILLSPGFDSDRTAFARVAPAGGRRGLYRSRDGGRSWQALDINPEPAAISPEFDQDHTLMGVTVSYVDHEERWELHISRDGGDHWERVGSTPGGKGGYLLSLAPLFEKWNVLFVLAHDHTLYRSADGGKSWDAVLNIASPIGGGALVVPAQLVYAPAGEANRQVFLLVRIRDNVDPASERGTLYRSGDGGLTWQEVGLPEGVSPTALAMSPNFAEDGLLFLGTADGQVRPLRTGR